MGYFIAFIAGGFVGFAFMAIFRTASKSEDTVEIKYDDDPIRRFVVRCEEITRPVIDLHYTTAIHREDFERFDDGELKNIVYEGLREQIIPALNIDIHKDFYHLDYLVDGSIYVVGKGEVTYHDMSDLSRC